MRRASEAWTAAWKRCSLPQWRGKQRMVGGSFLNENSVPSQEASTRSLGNLQAKPRDGGAWWAAVSGVAQSRTRLKRLSSSSSSSSKPKSAVGKAQLASDMVTNLRVRTIPGCLHALQSGVCKAPPHSLHTVWLPCNALSQHFEKLSSNVYEEPLNKFTLSSRNSPSNKLL